MKARHTERVPVATCTGCGASATIEEKSYAHTFVVPPDGTVVGWHPCPDTRWGAVHIMAWQKAIERQEKPSEPQWRLEEDHGRHWATLRLPWATVRGIVNAVFPDERGGLETLRIQIIDSLPPDAEKDRLARDQLIFRPGSVSIPSRGSHVPTSFASMAELQAALVSPMPTDAQMFCWCEVVLVNSNAHLLNPAREYLEDHRNRLDGPRLLVDTYDQVDTTGEEP